MDARFDRLVTTNTHPKIISFGDHITLANKRKHGVALSAHNVVRGELHFIKVVFGDTPLHFIKFSSTLQNSVKTFQPTLLHSTKYSLYSTKNLDTPLKIWSTLTKLGSGTAIGYTALHTGS